MARMGREEPGGCGLGVFAQDSAVCPCGWHDEGDRKCPEIPWKMLPRTEGRRAVSANTRMVASAGEALVFYFVFSWTHLQRTVCAGIPSPRELSRPAPRITVGQFSLGRILLSLAGVSWGWGGGGAASSLFLFVLSSVPGYQRSSENVCCFVLI